MPDCPLIRKAKCRMEADPLPTAEKKPPKLRWYQWRLRSMLILTLLVAIGMSYVAVTMRNQRKQTAAGEKIMGAGGTLGVEWTWLGKLLRDHSLMSVTSVDLSDKPITDDVLVHLEAIGQLRELFLSGTNISDAGLLHLQSLRQLTHLELANTKVTDAGMMHLQGLGKLQYLNLKRTKVTVEGEYKLRQALPECIIER